MSASGGGTIVPAVLRAGAILDALAEGEGRPLSVSELARQVGVPKSSTANLCASLEEAGLIARGPAGGYLLGRKLAVLGGRYLSTVNQVTEFYQQCRTLERISRETARVAVLEGLDVLYLARYDGAAPLRLTANIGDRFPATCTATGKALLATLDPAVVRDRLSGVSALPRLTERSLATIPQLMDELARVRELGYAVDDEETTAGVLCLSMPVGRFKTERAPFAVSVTLLKARADEATREAMLGELAHLVDSLNNPMQPPWDTPHA